MSATLLKNPIERPDEPRHFMEIKPIDHAVSADINGQQIAYSKEALLIQEVGQSIYKPVVYFPRQDVKMSFLTETKDHTHCPLKGQSAYFNIGALNETFHHAAWSYQTVLDFDERLNLIYQKIAFDTRIVHIDEWTHIK